MTINNVTDMNWKSNVPRKAAVEMLLTVPKPLIPHNIPHKLQLTWVTENLDYKYSETNNEKVNVK